MKTAKMVKTAKNGEFTGPRLEATYLLAEYPLNPFSYLSSRVGSNKHTQLQYYSISLDMYVCMHVFTISSASKHDMEIYKAIWVVERDPSKINRGFCDTRAIIKSSYIIELMQNISVQ